MSLKIWRETDPFTLIYFWKKKLSVQLHFKTLSDSPKLHHEYSPYCCQIRKFLSRSSHIFTSLKELVWRAIKLSSHKALAYRLQGSQDGTTSHNFTPQNLFPLPQFIVHSNGLWLGVPTPVPLLQLRLQDFKDRYHSVSLCLPQSSAEENSREVCAHTVWLSSECAKEWESWSSHSDIT